MTQTSDTKAKTATAPPAPLRLQKAALAAEIVAAAAVVISLIFVGAQLSRHTNEMVASSHHELLALLNDNDNWFQNPEFAALMARSEQGRDALSDTEYLQLAYWFGQRLSLCENVFERRQDGLIEDGMWSAWSNGCAAINQNPTALAAWEERREWFAPAFANWFDAQRE
ncbi:MAG: hypothetical protein AAFW81_08745 [Pseudomonadota bacterium]